MVKYPAAALDATFGALADPVRRAILARLARGESSVSELAAPFAISLPGFSKHLHVLERAGLVLTAKHGRVRRCRFEPGAMTSAAKWIAHYRAFWEDQFDALAEHLAETEKESNDPKKEKTEWPHQVLPPTPHSKSKGRSPHRSPPSTTPGRSRNV